MCNSKKKKKEKIHSLCVCENGQRHEKDAGRRRFHISVSCASLFLPLSDLKWDRETKRVHLLHLYHLHTYSRSLSLSHAPSLRNGKYVRMMSFFSSSFSCLFVLFFWFLRSGFVSILTKKMLGVDLRAYFRTTLPIDTRTRSRHPVPRRVDVQPQSLSRISMTRMQRKRNRTTKRKGGGERMQGK